MKFCVSYEREKHEESQVLEFFLNPLLKKIKSKTDYSVKKYTFPGIEVLEVYGSISESKILSFARESKVGLEVICENYYSIKTLKQLPALKKVRSSVGRTSMKKATTAL